MRIVLVDPSRTVCHIVTDLVQQWKHEVHSFSDGAEALAYIQQDDAVRAVITSAELPSMSGVEFARQGTRFFGKSQAALYHFDVFKRRIHQMRSGSGKRRRRFYHEASDRGGITRAIANGGSRDLDAMRTGASCKHRIHGTGAFTAGHSSRAPLRCSIRQKTEVRRARS